jgi:LAO/AO transport system kinase
MREQELGWNYPILKTVATENEGIQELVSSIQAHSEYLTETGKLVDERKAKLLLRVHELIEQNIRMHLREKIIHDEELAVLVDKIYKRQINPYRVAGRITQQIINSSR